MIKVIFQEMSSSPQSPAQLAATRQKPLSFGPPAPLKAEEKEQDKSLGRRRGALSIKKEGARKAGQGCALPVPAPARLAAVKSWKVGCSPEAVEAS